jgi:MoxR-like ATPase
MPTITPVEGFPYVLLVDEKKPRKSKTLSADKQSLLDHAIKLGQELNQSQGNKTMTKLTNTQRTILRSRVRRHKDLANFLVAGQTVATLSNADLVQVARLLELEVPSDKAANFYEDQLKTGKPARAVMAFMDAAELKTGSGGAGMQFVAIDDVVPSVVPTDSTPNEEDETDTQDVTSTPAETPAAPKETHYAELARDELKRLQALGLGGQIAEYQAGLEALALKAFKPAEKIIERIEIKVPVHTMDASKIKGHIAKNIASRMAQVAGMNSAYGMDANQIALDVYDAVDAPAIDKSYIWPDCAVAVVAQLARGRSAYLWGPASTGKTSFAKQIAANFGRSYVRISCTETTEAETLVGMTVPDTANGGVKWQDGQLTAAIRKPGTIVHIDEVTVARTGALFVLQSVMDEERAIHIAETGEVVRLAPGVSVILSDNTNGTGDQTGQYESTRIMNRAFLDRAGITCKLDYMDPNLEAKALVARTKCKPQLAALLTRFAQTTRRKADSGDVSHGLTMRRLIALAELITDGMDPNFAFQSAVIETAPFDDREPLRQLWTADADAARMKIAAAK